MDPTTRKFLRAAKQRHAVAQFLVDHTFCLDAVYLAGYAIECASKALLLQRTAKSKRHDLLASDLFRSSRGHNLELLATRLRDYLALPVPIWRAFIRVQDRWSTALRYESGLVKTAEANQFLSDAESIIKWAERSL